MDNKNKDGISEETLMHMGFNLSIPETKTEEEKEREAELALLESFHMF